MHCVAVCAICACVCVCVCARARPIRPCEQEVRKRHREKMREFHPDKAPADKVGEYTERAARLNRAKEIILR